MFKTLASRWNNRGIWGLVVVRLINLNSLHSNMSQEFQASFPVRNAIFFVELLLYLLNIWLLYFLTAGPPKITLHPKSQSVSTGADITFTVEAIGNNLQFQWQKDGADIDRNDSRFSSSLTDSTSILQIQRVEESDKGHYRCVVKNPVEQRGIPSQEAKLTVGKFVVPLCNVVGEFVLPWACPNANTPLFVHYMYLESEVRRRRLLEYSFSLHYTYVPGSAYCWLCTMVNQQRLCWSSKA